LEEGGRVVYTTDFEGEREREREGGRNIESGFHMKVE
jgi:hypothetical protein